MKHMPAEPAYLKVEVDSDHIGVDRQNNILRGYVVAQEGPFKTPDRGEFDEQGLRRIIKLMKQEPQGLKSRFTHPTLSDDGLGKFLGRAKEPRMDQVRVRRGKEVKELKAVRADLHLDPTSFHTPAGDLGGYVLDLADSDPDALSSSLVLEVEQVYRLDNHGKPRRDDTGNLLPPLWQPLALHASDIVDMGDAVDGVLSASLSAEELPDAAVRRGCALLDRVFAGQAPEVIHARCLAWLGRYLDYRFGPAAWDPGGPRLTRPNARRRVQARL